VRDSVVKQNNIAAEKLMDLAAAHVIDGIKNSKWFLTAPERFRRVDPEIEISGIEYHSVFTSSGGLSTGSYDAPFLCGETEVGGIKASFRLRLDFGTGGFVINEL
jgi:hypothetical protein